MISFLNLTSILPHDECCRAGTGTGTDRAVFFHYFNLAGTIILLRVQF
jgi:hypothetical protein